MVGREANPIGKQHNMPNAGGTATAAKLFSDLPSYIHPIHTNRYRLVHR